MSSIAQVFEKGEKAFIPYITAGYPNKETTVHLCKAMAEAGADIIELGIPFSDPLADGPVIQESFQKALDGGISLDDCFSIAREVRTQTAVPLIFMIAYNLVLQKGSAEFAEACVSSGIDGLIIPDLPPEHAQAEYALFNKAGIDMIFLIAPNTPEERSRIICEQCSGYLYCLSRLGITGARTDIADGLEEYLTRLRTYTDLPLCVGFGISRPEHAATVYQWADGAIVGSAIVNMITEYADDREKMTEKITAYVSSMKYKKS